jgi:hypothetical protein
LDIEKTTIDQKTRPHAGIYLQVVMNGIERARVVRCFSLHRRPSKCGRKHRTTSDHPRFKVHDSF